MYCLHCNRRVGPTDDMCRQDDACRGIEIRAWRDSTKALVDFIIGLPLNPPADMLIKAMDLITTSKQIYP